MPPVWHPTFIFNPCNPGQPDTKAHALEIIPTASQRTEEKYTCPKRLKKGWRRIHIPGHSFHPEYPFLLFWDFSSLLWKAFPLIPIQFWQFLATVPFLAFLNSMYVRGVITCFCSEAVCCTEHLPSGLCCLLVYPRSSCSLHLPLWALLSHQRCISRWIEQNTGWRFSPGYSSQSCTEVLKNNRWVCFAIVFWKEADHKELLEVLAFGEKDWGLGDRVRKTFFFVQ